MKYQISFDYGQVKCRTVNKSRQGVVNNQTLIPYQLYMLQLKVPKTAMYRASIFTSKTILIQH